MSTMHKMPCCFFLCIILHCLAAGSASSNCGERERNRIQKCLEFPFGGLTEDPRFANALLAVKVGNATNEDIESAVNEVCRQSYENYQCVREIIQDCRDLEDPVAKRVMTTILKICKNQHVYEYARIITTCNNKVNLTWSTFRIIGHNESLAGFDRTSPAQTDYRKLQHDADCRVIHGLRRVAPNTIIKEKCGPSAVEAYTFVFGEAVAAYQCDKNSAHQTRIFSGYIVLIGVYFMR